jgi:hypothetical protein
MQLDGLRLLPNVNDVPSRRLRARAHRLAHIPTDDRTPIIRYSACKAALAFCVLASAGRFLLRDVLAVFHGHVLPIGSSAIRRTHRLMPDSADRSLVGSPVR